MDSLTHVLLGAAVGELVLGRKMGNRAMAWGALAGLVPDIDVVFPPFLGNASKLWWHRGPTHSLLIIMLGSWLLSKWLARWWGKWKVTQQLAWAFLFAEWYAHVLIDCFSVYGTAVLWPFSSHRVAFGNLFIIDPLFTAPLLVTVVWMAFLWRKSDVRRRRRLNLWGLALAFTYVLLSVWARQSAKAVFDSDLTRRGLAEARRTMSPTPFNIALWRTVVEQPGELWVGYSSLLDKSGTPIRWEIYPRGESDFAKYASKREVRRVARFSDGWWIARSHVRGLWIADLRFGEVRNWREKRQMVDCTPSFAWNYLQNSHGEKLNPVRPTKAAMDGMLQRLVERVFGNTAQWRGYPRLSGATGHLPESLSFQE